MKEFRAGGKKALKKAGRAGRKPELTEADRGWLGELLLKTPEELGYKSSVWTCASVTDLIVEEFGIEYHPGHVWKILDHLGWSRQRQVLLGRRRSNSIPDRARRKSSKSSRASGDPSSVGRKLREILEKIRRK